jgi:hypothetical protein
VLPVSAYYFDGYPNFGDALNVPILEKVFGTDVRQAAPGEASILGIGSVLATIFPGNWCGVRMEEQPRSSDPIHIWTTGFLEEPKVLAVPLRRPIVHALRGPRTKHYMEQLLGYALPVPLGDGGLLCSELLESDPVRDTDIGLCGRPDQLKGREYKDLQYRTGAAFIDVTQPAAEVLEAISHCKTIASACLHPLVAADALHIPNVQLRPEAQSKESLFKFLDYYGAYGKGEYRAWRTAEIKDRASIENRCHTNFDDVDYIKQQLLEAFPRFL